MSGAEFEGVLPDLQGTDTAEIRGLIERNARIQDMTQHPGWALFCDYLVALVEPMQHRILNGYAANIEQYRTETGYVSGIKAALEAPSRLAQKVDAMREDLEEQLVLTDE